MPMTPEEEKLANFVPQKIQDLPDDYEAPVHSIRYRNYKKVLMTSPQGVRFGWESPDGILHPGSLVEPNEEYLEGIAKEQAHIEEQRTKVRQREVTLRDLKERREQGEKLTDDDLGTLVDLLTGRL